MTTSVVMDTEFAWDPTIDHEGRDTDPEFSPHAPNAIIVSISYVVLDPESKTPVELGIVSGGDERERLTQFVRAWSTYPTRLVTFAGRGADIQLMQARLMRHMLQAPRFFESVVDVARFNNEHHLDLYEKLSLYGAQRRGGMSAWARCFGWPGKMDVDGSSVATMLRDGRESEVDAYCLCDSVQQAAIYLRTLLSRARIHRKHYDLLARELLRVALADERTRRMAERVDVGVWLEGEPRFIEWRKPKAEAAE